MTRYCSAWWAQPVAEPDTLLDVLDEQERSRYDAYQNDGDRARFATARLVAKSAVAELTGQQPADIRFTTRCAGCGGPHGRPTLGAGYPPLELSLAHSGDRIVVAIMNGFRIGVDVERVDYAAEVDQLTWQEFDKIERSMWLELPEPDRVEGYFRVWTRKQSLIKAVDRALDFEMREVMVAAADDEPGVLQIPVPGLDTHGVAMYDLDTSAGYVASLSIITSGDVVVTERTWEPTAPSRTRFRVI
ncbi:MAG: 4'-phosphopantetheinyl transferase family protein [Sciscionella sp.]